ncbi:glycosyl hydrolase [Streptomyces sp. NPDC001941]|uniref:glycosyl hydrolase n=1 Tax=Streptomyces sp. NPDC001941 TaxID=3154659 RepID=UPI00331B1BF7
MERRTALRGAGGLIAAGAGLGSGAGSSAPVHPPEVPRELARRDPRASAEARAVYAFLADLENAARAGRPRATVLGQHVELHNELLNPEYGDCPGTKPPGYYYRKAADITGKLPGFVEVDLGPGYGQPGWAVDHARPYNARWPSGRTEWAYVDAAVDLATGVWDGLPRRPDGSHNPGGDEPRSDGLAQRLPDNGGGPAGLVGVSFHQPWPGSPVKGYPQTFWADCPGARDPRWADRLLTPGTDEHRELLVDLDFLADHLGYLAERGVPVLLRPFHEMNTDTGGGFWWSGLGPERFGRLWRLAYRHLVETRDLHHLIFVWAPHAWDGEHGHAPWDHYPGDEFVDVVGVDDYDDRPEAPRDGKAWTGEWYRGLADYGKPRVLAETFRLPLGPGREATLDRTPWTLWTVWGQGLTQHNLSGPRDMNTDAHARASYESPLTAIGGPHAGAWTRVWESLHSP